MSRNLKLVLVALILIILIFEVVSYTRYILISEIESKQELVITAIETGGTLDDIDLNININKLVFQKAAPLVLVALLMTIPLCNILAEVALNINDGFNYRKYNKKKKQKYRRQREVI